MPMERKHEFKPDKPRTGWLSKLYLTQKQRSSILKWSLYALVILLLSVVQDVVMCRLRIFGATTELVPCGILLVSVLVGTERGCVFALLASCGYLFSGSSPGVYSMVILTVLSIGAAAFRQGYLKKGFAANLLCVVVALLLYEMVVFAIGLFLGLTIVSRLPGFLVTTGLTALAAPVLYAILQAIEAIGGESWKE